MSQHSSPIQKSIGNVSDVFSSHGIPKSKSFKRGQLVLHEFDKVDNISMLSLDNIGFGVVLDANVDDRNSVLVYWQRTRESLKHGSRFLRLVQDV